MCVHCVRAKDAELTLSVMLRCRQIGDVARNYGMITDTAEYVDSFSPALMEIVQAWAEGARFMDILKISVVFEVGDLCVARCLMVLWHYEVVFAQD